MMLLFLAWGLIASHAASERREAETAAAQEQFLRTQRLQDDVLESITVAAEERELLIRQVRQLQDEIYVLIQAHDEAMRALHPEVVPPLPSREEAAVRGRHREHRPPAPPPRRPPPAPSPSPSPTPGVPQLPELPELPPVPQVEPPPGRACEQTDRAKFCR